MTQKAEPVTSTFSGNKGFNILHHFMRKIIIGAVLIILVVVAVIAINVHRENSAKTGVCSVTLIKGSYLDFSLANTGALANNVQTIQGLTNYQHDPNCMYILTVYYVKIFNINQAQNSLKLFNQAYNGQNLNSILIRYASVAELKQLVSSTMTESQQIQKNAENLSPKPAVKRP